MALLGILPERNNNGFKDVDLALKKRRVRDKLKRCEAAIDYQLMQTDEEVEQ
jgi:hypothetical protein